MSHRILPAPEAHEVDFWSGGSVGELRMGWCGRCERLRHPALQFCDSCQAAIAEYRAVSGFATVLAVTVNHQRWLSGYNPPYAIAIVGLIEDPDIRLTTNVVDIAPEKVTIGDRVSVRFVQQDDIWLPVFAPAPEPAAVPSRKPNDLPEVVTIARSPTPKFEEKVVLSGCGTSSIARRIDRSPLSLCVEACTSAIEDAGLSIADIDGVCAYPGSDGLPGISSGGFRALEQVLRIRPVWHCGAAEVPGQAGTVIDAMLAVASGLCRHVLCFTTFSESARPSARGAAGRVAGEMSWRVPFGAASPANWIALYASRYMSRFGADRDMLGWIAVNTRLNALRNPAAIYRTPITMQDHADARPISSPFGLLDCDVPCDGAIAFVVSAIETARDLRWSPVRIEAVGTKITERQSWDQGTLTHQPNVFGPAAHLWSRSDFRPDDVDVAMLYDGFTFNVVSWIEALGFCGIGEATDFLDGGRRIAPTGGLPLNPHGGHLSAGRTNGYGHLLEAILQLRGTAGERQVAGCSLAVVSSGGGIPASCMLLRKQ